MKVLLLTIANKKNQKMNRDIALEFVKNGHEVFIACPADNINKPSSTFEKIEDLNYLFIKTGYSTGKVNIVKKIYNMMTIDFYYKNAIKKAKLSDINLILYSTPPITLVKTISWAKKNFDSNTYLMLKDIFPQNAVDMGMMKKYGPMKFIWSYFRKKEKKLYNISDFIGCMSQGNCDYILKNNNELKTKQVGLCVNSYANKPVINIDKEIVRKKYGIPEEKTIFIYGGNLGKPQGLDFFVDIMKSNQEKNDRYFVICGGGNEQGKIQNYIRNEKPDNVKYISSIPTDEYDELLSACDVGLVFLDNRFTIPNFPSRILSIMLNEKPVLAATDIATDLGVVIETADIGWWCRSGDLNSFNNYLDEICNNNYLIIEKGKKSRELFEKKYTSEVAYNQIIEGLIKIGEK